LFVTIVYRIVWIGFGLVIINLYGIYVFFYNANNKNATRV